MLLSYVKLAWSILMIKSPLHICTEGFLSSVHLTIILVQVNGKRIQQEYECQKYKLIENVSNRSTNVKSTS